MARSAHAQLQAERKKREAIDRRIAELEAQEIERLGQAARRVGLFEVEVPDDALEAGLRHAMALANGKGAAG